MKLSTWAKKNGISYWTAWRWFRDGQLPVNATQVPTGTIIVHEPNEQHGKTVIYARVSSSGQKKDIERQVARIVLWLSKEKITVDETITEIGSGLNGKRRKLLRLLRDPSVTTIVVEHRDRLVRFGFEMIEATMLSRGGKLLVVDETELTDDLVRDMTDLLTSLCARLYGKRSAKARAQRALEAVNANT